MPLLLDRRSFLKTSLAGAVVASTATHLTAVEAKPEIRWALLSDIHIAADAGDTYRGFRPHENLKLVLQNVQAKPFDMLVVNGDLARLEGKPADYEAVVSLLDPLTRKMPLVMTMGNHDDRKNARGAVASVSGEVQPVQKKFVTTIDAGPVDFVLLDSLLATDVAAGQLGHSQREWLAHYLKTNNRKPTLIFVHHNLDADDDNAMVDAARFLEIVRPAKNVKAVIFGHTHAWNHSTQDGLHLVNIPAVAYNFKDSEPVGWTESTFTAKRGTLNLRAIGGNTSNDGQTLNLLWR
jgi:3',5'-cyclic-AMP phosphodiesterase